MPSPVLKGVTTIIWGTSGPNCAPAGAIVESLAITPKNGEPIEIENNDGFTVTELLLHDGFNAKASIVLDSNLTYPLASGTVALTLPLQASNGAANNTASYSCLVCSTPEITNNRKKEGMVNFQLTYRPLVVLT